jgi:hypothetical protein
LSWVAALAFHPGGKVVAAGDSSGLVRTWDTSTGREIGRPLFQGEIVLSVAYNPDGEVLAVGLANDLTGEAGVRLWDTTTRHSIGELLPSTERVTRIEFRPDGRALLAVTDRFARLRDKTLRRGIGEPLLDEAASGFHFDGQTFLMLGRDGTVELRDATSGQVLGRLLSSSSATCAAIRGNGGLVAAGFEDGALRLCDLATSQPVGPPRFMKHAVHHLPFTSDGRTVCAIDIEGEFRTWPVTRAAPGFKPRGLDSAN